jgi:hypothetical protein
MAIQRDKKWHGFLLQGVSTAALPSATTIFATIPSGATVATALFYLPQTWYPLNGQNQLELNWYINTMPTAATYVQITPVVFEVFGTTSSAGLPRHPGFPTTSSGFEKSFARMTWDSFNAASNRCEELHPL